VVRHADDATRCCWRSSGASRRTLSPIEKRGPTPSLDEFALTLGDVAERVGRSKPSVVNRLRLLDLPDDVLGMIERGELTEGHARAVLAVPGQEERRELARLIVRRGLSVRAAEQAARWAGAKQKPRRRNRVDPALAERVRLAGERVFGKPVKVTAGKLEIAVADEYELAELAEALELLATAD
jgi:ParB family chromosome partitioning protein